MRGYQQQGIIAISAKLYFYAMVNLEAFYAYNFKTKTLVWEKDFQDIDFFRPSPCIVIRSGKVHRGGMSQ